MAEQVRLTESEEAAVVSQRYSGADLIRAVERIVAEQRAQAKAEALAAVVADIRDWPYWKSAEADRMLDLSVSDAVDSVERLFRGAGEAA